MITDRLRLAAGIFVAGAISSAAHAQDAAPITVTPQTLAPERRDNGFQVEIPEAGALSPPQGAEGLSLTLGDVVVEGAFPEVRDQVDAIVAGLRGRPATLAEIYAAASQIEAAHARAGFILARVSVPPQELRDGSMLRIVVTDGFVEQVDVSALPPRVRRPVAARVREIEGRRHIRLSELEQALLIASEVPGLSLRSTLMRGEQPGGTRIVLEGAQAPVSGSVSLDNSLDPSLGRWGVTTQLALNNLLGAGEQIYGFAANDYDVTHWFDDEAKSRVLGGGAFIAFGSGRFVLNPEYTYSRTAPEAARGAPDSIGTLRRISLRASYSLNRTRAGRIALNGTIEQLSVVNALPQFRVDLSHDRYMAARLGINLVSEAVPGSSYGVVVQLSQGLGDLGAISKAEAAASRIGYSRFGADNSFTKLTVQARAGWSIGRDFDLGVSAKSQTSFGQPVFRSEQFALEGSDAISAYVGGATAVDEGVAARAELGTRIRSGTGKGTFDLAPYLFGAGGIGWIARPTVLEPDDIRAAAIGAGARLNLPGLGWSLSVEYAHGFSDLAPLDNQDRVNVATTIRF
jgi:hemolysin activation/secretion protein